MGASVIRLADGSPAVNPRMRNNHKPVGNPCRRCGRKMLDHYFRQAPDQAKIKKYQARKKEERREKRVNETIVHIDGEGIHGLERDGIPHTYIYLSAVDENNLKHGSIYNPYGLSTVTILEFLLDLEVSKVFGYSLGYDFTEWLKDMPAELLYLLVRPDKRAFVDDETKQHRHRAIFWSPGNNLQGYKFTYLRRRMQIQRYKQIEGDKKYYTYGNSVVVWDVFAFFQGKFTKALEDWRICSKEIIARIAAMKDNRATLERHSPEEVQAYCDDENHNGGKLVRSLIDSHENAGLPLTSFYGAGSTSSVLLNKIGIKEYLDTGPEEMQYAVMCAFFGGRFELDEVGPLLTECFNHDISSAYPYAMCHLPCLTHGKWRFIRRNVDKQIRTSKLALVHCRVRRSGPRCWGPLPFRDDKGNITFPLSCDGTWTWKSEYLAAKDTLWPGVEPIEAWVYNSGCDCKPFADIPTYYLERLKLGKDGPGIALKLAINGGYGKLAQSEGAAPFRNMIYAGNTTSITRGMLLTAASLAKDPFNIKMMATDGILATEKLNLPMPIETGTNEPYLDPDKKVIQQKPLGGWEIESQPKGVMLCRPGIYFPLSPTEEDLKKVRARGIHRGTLLKHAERIIYHFEKHGPNKEYDAGTVTRFLGAKQGIGIGAGGEIVKRKHFGEWVQWPVKVSFNPTPKRKRINPGNSLACWNRMAGESKMYDKGVIGSEGKAMKELQELLEDSGDDLTL